ncbi:MAG: hypothetical protein GY799_32600 [Desulfobulbaceae bacterium]|nr:hypothetical protein [Desulfobulbaceae bacterium]
MRITNSQREGLEVLKEASLSHSAHVAIAEICTMDDKDIKDQCEACMWAGECSSAGEGSERCEEREP